MSLKPEILVWIAGLPEDAPELLHVNSIRCGDTHAGEDAGPCMTISQVAKRSGFSRPVIYRALACGALKSTIPYPGGRQRISEHDYQQWIGRKGRSYASRT
jgi:excisionase family DNA binding protein